MKNSKKVDGAAAKRILRRKRNVIASNIEMDQKMAGIFMESGLMTQEMYNVIKEEKTNSLKMIKFIDILPANSYNKLCSIVSNECEWLADELRAELRAETNKLVVEDYIQKEASMLVQKEFGHSKRLSEPEKKAMASMVALRTQVAKEVWKSQLGNVQNVLEKEVSSRVEKIRRLEAITERVRRTNLVHLKDTNSSKREEIETRFPDESLMQFLARQVDLLINIITNILHQRDELIQEKVDALKELNIKADPYGPKLEIELKAILDKINKDINDAKKELEEKDETTKELNEQLTELEITSAEEIRQKEEQIRDLKDHLDQCHSKITELHQDINQTEKLQYETANELVHYKTRCMMIEKQRHLGFKLVDKSAEDGVKIIENGSRKGTPGSKFKR